MKFNFSIVFVGVSKILRQVDLLSLFNDFVVVFFAASFLHCDRTCAREWVRERAREWAGLCVRGYFFMVLVTSWNRDSWNYQTTEYTQRENFSMMMMKNNKYWEKWKVAAAAAKRGLPVPIAFNHEQNTHRHTETTKMNKCASLPDFPKHADRGIDGNTSAKNRISNALTNVLTIIKISERCSCYYSIIIIDEYHGMDGWHLVCSP